MSTITAVLDANVLFPASLRDILLRAVEQDLYRFYWTDEILEEVRRNLVKKGILTDQQAQKLVSTIMHFFSEGQVPLTYQSRIASMTNDPKDRHVLAAAIEIGADTIVTFNLHDFPTTALAPYNIRAIVPDDFLLTLLQAYPEQMVVLMRRQVQELQHPPLSIEELLAILHVHAPRYCKQIQPLLALADP